MTSPEKIEELLKRFGQTISDLPSPNDYGLSGESYGVEQEKQAKKMAYVWTDEYMDGDIIPIDDVEPPLLDFICHQSDVIERLVAALETAEQVASCEFCKKHEDKCSSSSKFDCEGFELDEQDV